MRLVVRVRNAIRRRLEKPTIRIVKQSPDIVAVAEVLRTKARLSRLIRARMNSIRAAMLADDSPYPKNTYGDHQTVGEHFLAASSGYDKLSVLETLVRWKDAKSVLEVGTAYGLSAITLAMAQKEANVWTIEAFEPQATIGPQNISAAVRGVTCITERKESALPRLCEEGRRFDFVYHDGGHSGDDYVRDFHTILPMLEPGSLYIIDDIAWDDDRHRLFTQTRSRRTCREGWNEVMEDSQVKGALVYAMGTDLVGIALT